MATRTKQWGVDNKFGCKDGSDSLFLKPGGITVDNAGDVFVFDTGNQRIRKISRKDGTVSTYVQLEDALPREGSDSVTSEIASGFERLFISYNSCIFQISKDKTVMLLAGQRGRTGCTDGSLLESSLPYSAALAVDEKNHTIFVADSKNSLIRMISLNNGIVSTIAGMKETVDAGMEKIDTPYAIALDQSTGDLFITDNTYDKVMKVSKQKGSNDWVVTSVVLLGDKTSIQYFGLAIYHNMLFVTCWDTGLIIQADLDGGNSKWIGRVQQREMGTLAADATQVYISKYHSHTILAITWAQYWSPQDHLYFRAEQRHIIGIVVIASQCLTRTTSSSLQKLPRDILFFILSFLSADNPPKPSEGMQLQPQIGSYEIF
jgi:DNA-binding beta-propeller fold protein YncE